MRIENLYKKVKNISIIDVISYYDIPIKNNKISCLWHSDKTPSAYIYEDTNTGSCFGCGKYFDAISIVMKMENKEFVDALYLMNRRFSSDGTYIFSKKKNLDFYFAINDELKSLIKQKKDLDIIKKYGQIMDLFSDNKDILIKLYDGLLTKLKKR